MFYLMTSLALLLLALLPLAMVTTNLKQFHKTKRAESSSLSGPKISVLVPARNEASSIANSLDSITAQRYNNLELLVLDDHSQDDTSNIVKSYEARHANVRLVSSQQLPDGWNGKQFACWQLASQATGEYFLFLDADVRLEPDAVARIWASYQDAGVNLYSGFPKQETGSFAERALIPMMYLLLLGYLPLSRSRSDQLPSMAAGCGQLFFTDRDSYFAVHGHASIKSSRHDGLMLPRAYRNQGTRTDLFDASDIARCRMYHNVREVTVGLLKNASEGIANPRLIFIFSVLLLGAFVLPLMMLLHALFWNWPLYSVVILGIATVVSFIPRFMLASRWESSYLGAAMNPLAVVWFVAFQWIAFARSLSGKSVAWRGRSS